MILGKVAEDSLMAGFYISIIGSEDTCASILSSVVLPRAVIADDADLIAPVQFPARSFYDHFDHHSFCKYFPPLSTILPGAFSIGIKRI